MDIPIVVAFVGGIVSFLSPCILPLVPAYISYLAGTSVADGEGKKSKPSRRKTFLNALFFVIGFALIFSLIGVLLASVLSNVALDARKWLSWIGGAVIIFFGIYLTGILKIGFLGSQHRFSPRRFKSSYLTSFVFGVAFAAGWTPCVGAVLGGILTLAIVQPAQAFNLMLAYAFGLGIPFLIAGAFVSQFSSFISKFAGFMRYFTVSMGVVLIVLGALIVTGYIGYISVFIPLESIGPVGIDSALQEQAQSPPQESTQTAVEEEPEEPAPKKTEEKASLFLKDAPELVGISGYINAPDGFTLSQLEAEDKVVLVDFWTYSCINCQRTTPYLNAWHEKYADDGLVIVGVHSPEFAFEKERAGLEDAMERFGIKYAVVQDNDFKTWRAYDNRFWPRKYLIDIDGKIRYDHIGEGAYDETEGVIRQLLAHRAERLGSDMPDQNESRVDADQVDFSRIGTREIYFGYKFLSGRNYVGNLDPTGIGREISYSIPDAVEWADGFSYLEGVWKTDEDYSSLSGGAGQVGLRYSAKDVNIVAGGDAKLRIFLDGKEISETDSGSDVVDGQVLVSGERLYNIVDGESYGTHDLLIEAEGGLRMYTFTFG